MRWDHRTGLALEDAREALSAVVGNREILVAEVFRFVAGWKSGENLGCAEDSLRVEGRRVVESRKAAGERKAADR